MQVKHLCCHSHPPVSLWRKVSRESEKTANGWEGKVLNRLPSWELDRWWGFEEEGGGSERSAKLMVGILMDSYSSGFLEVMENRRWGLRGRPGPWRCANGWCIISISRLSISLIWVSHQVEKFLCSPGPTIAFWPSTWSQATMTWILANHELKQSFPTFSCSCQLFVTEWHEKWWAQPHQAGTWLWTHKT